MAALSFYKYVRADDGVRYGVDVDKETVLSEFQEGPDHDDPRVKWQFEARCIVRASADDPEGVRQWLLANGEPWRRELQGLAAIMERGLSPDSLPYIVPLSDTLPRAKMVLVISAIKRFPGPDFATEMRRFRDDWDRILTRLSPAEPSAVGT